MSSQGALLQNYNNDIILLNKYYKNIRYRKTKETERGDMSTNIKRGRI